MLGAIIGDIAGSRFEFRNHRSKEFELLSRAERCRATDDSIMSLAIAQAVLDCAGNYTGIGEVAKKRMLEYGQRYPYAGYGCSFYDWLISDNPMPYNSYGNGAAMRISAVGLAARSLEEAIEMARKVTEITHNHPEGIKGAEATAAAIYLARTGCTISEIRKYIADHYYKIDFTIDEIRPTYEFNESCQETVPQALEAFFESTDFEDAIRTAVSVGGDSDTLAAITGGIAEAYYGIPSSLRTLAMSFLDQELSAVVTKFEEKFPCRSV